MPTLTVAEWMARAAEQCAERDATHVAELQAAFVRQWDGRIDWDPDDPWPGWFILVNGRGGVQCRVEILPDDILL